MTFAASFAGSSHSEFAGKHSPTSRSRAAMRSTTVSNETSRSTRVPPSRLRRRHSARLAGNVCTVSVSAFGPTPRVIPATSRGSTHDSPTATRGAARMMTGRARERK